MIVGPENDYGLASVVCGAPTPSIALGVSASRRRVGGLGGQRLPVDAHCLVPQGKYRDRRRGRRGTNSAGSGRLQLGALELKVQGTLVKGSNLQLQFRISEDSQDFYFLDYLAGWKPMAISKWDEKTGVTKLDVVNFIFESGREYDIVLAVRGNSITSYIDGKLVNRLTVATNPRGGIALAIWGNHTIARFRDPKVRHYN